MKLTPKQTEIIKVLKENGGEMDADDIRKELGMSVKNLRYSLDILIKKKIIKKEKIIKEVTRNNNINRYFLAIDEIDI